MVHDDGDRQKFCTSQRRFGAEVSYNMSVREELKRNRKGVTSLPFLPVVVVLVVDLLP